MGNCRWRNTDFSKQSSALGRDYAAFIEIAEQLYLILAFCNGLGERMSDKCKKSNRRNLT